MKVLDNKKNIARLLRKSVRKRQANIKNRKPQKSPLQEVKEMDSKPLWNAPMDGHFTTAFEFAREIYRKSFGLRGVLVYIEGYRPIYVLNFGEIFQPCFEEAEFLHRITLQTYDPESQVVIAYPFGESGKFSLGLFFEHEIEAKSRISLHKPLSEYSTEDLDSFIIHGVKNEEN